MLGQKMIWMSINWVVNCHSIFNGIFTYHMPCDHTFIFWVHKVIYWFIQKNRVLYVFLSNKTSRIYLFALSYVLKGKRIGNVAVPVFLHNNNRERKIEYKRKIETRMMIVNGTNANNCRKIRSTGFFFIFIFSLMENGDGVRSLKTKWVTCNSADISSH